MSKEQKNRGFTLVEMLFWLALVVLIIGGFIYKNTKEIQKNPPNSNKQGGILGDLKSETESKQKIIEEN